MQSKLSSDRTETLCFYEDTVSSTSGQRGICDAADDFTVMMFLQGIWAKTGQGHCLPGEDSMNDISLVCWWVASTSWMEQCIVVQLLTSSRWFCSRHLPKAHRGSWFSQWPLFCSQSGVQAYKVLWADTKLSAQGQMLWPMYHVPLSLLQHHLLLPEDGGEETSKTK